jgi:hypothetical protein
VIKRSVQTSLQVKFHGKVEELVALESVNLGDLEGRLINQHEKRAEFQIAANNVRKTVTI